MPFPIQPLRNLSENLIGMPDVCAIERATEGEDEEGRPIEVWATVETTKCRLQGLSGTEVQVSGRLAPDSQLTAALPYPTDVTNEDRLVINGTRYEVEYVQEGSAMLQAHTKVFLQSSTQQDDA